MVGLWTVEGLWLPYYSMPHSLRDYLTRNAIAILMEARKNQLARDDQAFKLHQAHL